MSTTEQIRAAIDELWDAMNEQAIAYANDQLALARIQVNPTGAEYIRIGVAAGITVVMRSFMEIATPADRPLFDQFSRYFGVETPGSED